MRGIRIAALTAIVVAVTIAACKTDVTIPFQGTGPILPPDSHPEIPFYGSGVDGNVSTSEFSFPTTCHPISAGGTLGIVDNADALDVGREVLLLQTQDSAGNAGVFETARIASKTPLAGGSFEVFFTAPLSRDYTTSNSRRAQICHIPEYDVLTVSSNTTAAASFWDGRSGGVLAIAARRVVMNTNGFLAANSAGFRGGLCGPAILTTTHAFADDPPKNGIGGGKGEGLDPGAFSRVGRGSVGNSGGGGNARDGGGAGGANAGEGGDGGWGTELVDPGNITTASGRGGLALDSAGVPVLLLGGAGGAGQRDYDEGGEEPCQGGFGGGIVFILASSMTGTGTIDARGANGSNGLATGASGGGAGGTIFIRTMVSDWTGRADARGGNGGNTLVVGTNAHYGPGGGGGAGRIYADDPLFTPVLNGGAEGVNVSDPIDWGSRPGTTGFVAPTTF